MYTDFKVIDGIIPIKDAEFEDLFELIRTEREIIAAGAEAVGYEHARVKVMIRNTIAKNWGKFRSAGQRERQGDRGGFYGHFEQDMEGIVRQVMKPLDASYKNLANAQYNLSRFPNVFTRWMEPIKRPGPTRDSFRVDGRRGF